MSLKEERGPESIFVCKRCALFPDQAGASENPHVGDRPFAPGASWPCEIFLAIWVQAKSGLEVFQLTPAPVPGGQNPLFRHLQRSRTGPGLASPKLLLWSSV